MSLHSGWIAWFFFYGIMGFMVFYILHGYFLYRIIKKDPVYAKAKIVSYVPKAPNELGKVDIVMTYSFIANDETYSKDQQIFEYKYPRSAKILRGQRNPNYLLP